MRNRRRQIQFALVMLLIVVAVLSLVFRTINITKPFGFSRGNSETAMGLRLGLDLQGGTDLVYKAQDPNVTPDQMKGVLNVIQRRINAFGVSEPEIQLKGKDEIVIQLPGVKNIDDARKLIGGTAKLDFRELQTTSDGKQQWVQATGEGNDGVQKPLTGAYMKPTSAVVTDPQTGLPEVAFEFNGEGASLFEQITKRLVGQPLGIFLDDQLVSAPTVRSVIGQNGVITNIGIKDAQLLAIQLNAGALPVSITPIKEQDVSATLGKDSLQRSYLAGIIGLGLVIAFMMLYYRLPGVVASASLLIYVLLVLAIFKLLPVTLTLAGIAAFIVSMGMAVDASVLIFERMKEELRAGRSLGAAIEVGFDRAWPAIRDSNVTTFISCAILFWFGNTLGEPRVQGFALTLFVGVAASMFTAITITRMFLRLFVGTPVAKKIGLFAPVHPRPSERPAVSA